MSLQLAALLNVWLIVAYISIAYCLLKPVIVQARPAFAVTVVNVKIGNTMISYGRKKEYDYFR